MSKKSKQREEAKETLNFVIDDIVREITEEHLPKLPQMTDMAEIQEKYRPYEYTIDLAITEIYPVFRRADITASIQKKYSNKSYESFREYWNEARQKITDDNIHIGLRALHATEIFRNMSEYYGNDTQNPDVKSTAKALQEIVKRYITFAEKNKEKNITSLDAKQIDIQTEKLKKAKHIHVQSLYETLFLNTRIIGQIVEHEKNGKFRQGVPFQIKLNWDDKTDLKVMYD